VACFNLFSEFFLAVSLTAKELLKSAHKSQRCRKTESSTFYQPHGTSGQNYRDTALQTKVYNFIKGRQQKQSCRIFPPNLQSLQKKFKPHIIHEFYFHILFDSLFITIYNYLVLCVMAGETVRGHREILWRI